MKKLAIFVAAFVLTLGLAQCKKEQPTAQTTEGETVHITVKVGNGSRADIENPSSSGHYTFNDGDILYVGYNGAKVGGELTYSTSTGKFSGDLTIVQDGNDKPLYFYYMGGTAANMVDATHYTVDISNQASNYPVISCGTSSDAYTGPGAYTTTLLNKCALVKFITDEIEMTTPIVVKGLNNTVEVDFNGNTLSYSQTNEGAITLHPESATSRWAILLPQEVVTKGDVYTVNGVYVGTRPAIEGGIVENQYLSEGIEIYNPLTTPLTFEAKTAGATVTFSNNNTSLTINLQYKVNNDEWTTVNSSTTITLANVGDKVSFRGDNDRLATGMSVYCYFSNTGQCYIYGNLMSLLYSNSNTYSTATELNGTYTFYHLFENASNLYSHAYKTLELPATTLTDHCYDGMFYYCSNLTTAPELPATTLGQYCYKFMFEGCSNLTTVPERLPATTLQSGCYYGMFKECSSLTTAPELPAPTLVYQCYIEMFYHCRQLSSITCLATNPSNASGISNPYTYNWVSDVRTGSSCTFRRRSTNWATNSANGIYYGWTKIDI